MVLIEDLILSHSKAQQARVNKEIGDLEMIIITSRDPAAPGLDYLNACGGFFRDTTIHDFDLSRFILGDDPIIQVQHLEKIYLMKM